MSASCRAKRLSGPSPIEVDVKSENLRKRIEEWGGVSAKGLKGLVDVGNTASMPQRYVTLRLMST
jgi:hypothetical protein